MDIKEALLWGTNTLNKTARRKASHSDSPILDSEILLCAAIKKPKEFVFAHPEKKLTAGQVSIYKKLVARRAKHEPVAYVLGKKEFYGFEFFVNKNVLIPRPDTETLINSTVALSPKIIIDIGTGSGAIAITLKKLLSKAQVFASDVSSSALALAKKNAKCLKAKIIFKEGNLFEPFVIPAKAGIQRQISNWIPHQVRDDTPLVITANLPYLSQKEWQKCQPEIKKYEPYGALVGGKNGTEIYEKLFKQLAIFHSVEITLFMEIGHNQKSAIAKLAKKIIKPKKIECIKDLAGKWRVVKIII